MANAAQEQLRLNDEAWTAWGPYLSDRQWGTVREDYSCNGDAWTHITHDMARSKAYRWGEEGIAGISDRDQLLNFAIALWNKKDPVLKERYFGLSNAEGNHGEDVKELYYYLDNTPSHSYMKMLYKYPQEEYPYQWLIEENRRRTKNDAEFELKDTGIFNEDRYFDVFVEYAKKAPDDILIKITVYNRSYEDAPINVLPTIWFRNTWSINRTEPGQQMTAGQNSNIDIFHPQLGCWTLHAEGDPELLFTGNETNTKRLYDYDDGKLFYKDGINDYIVNGKPTVNPSQQGTKTAVNYDLVIKGRQKKVIRLRLSKNTEGFYDYENIFNLRKQEADQFYHSLLSNSAGDDAKMIQRQAFAGMLWNKQFYYFNVNKWLEGDTGNIKPPKERLAGRNNEWKHINSKDIISVPDKWEFPWFASWDLALHCLPLALIDMQFAKNQLLMLVGTWYVHPNGHLPAYEWDFNDANPPVHALATWLVYNADKIKHNGHGDLKFLEKVFHKLMLNFTWWVNRKDASGSNIFEGGFLGLDNIGVFDRNTHLPNGARLEQADATSWMAMYSLNLLRIAIELGKHNDVYEGLAAKFFEHFLSIVGAMAGKEGSNNLWDEEDGFYYDRLRYAGGKAIPLKVRSIIGLIPLFAVEIIEENDFLNRSQLEKRIDWFKENRPDLADLVAHWAKRNEEGKHLISLVRGNQLRRILERMFDEKEFLSDYGIRSLSKYHEQHPFRFGSDASIQYTPGESTTGIYGGNSNWRGPVWIPINFLIIENLRRYHEYYGDDFKIAFPTGSGNYINLSEAADELGKRLTHIFLKNEKGTRAVFGKNDRFQNDPHFKDYILFHEYFHGDDGHGLGASHQTGWTGLIIRYLFASAQKAGELVKNHATVNRV